MNVLLELAERCEAAEGPCIGLDAEIELAVGNFSSEHYEAWCRFQECGESMNPSMAEPCPPHRFTASLDAAMTLVPEGWEWSLEANETEMVWPVSQAWTYRCQMGHLIDREAATPALALCAAALRARASS